MGWCEVNGLDFYLGSSSSNLDKDTVILAVVSLFYPAPQGNCWHNTSLRQGCYLQGPHQFFFVRHFMYLILTTVLSNPQGKYKLEVGSEGF
jgi:hypothetical protein